MHLGRAPLENDFEDRLELSTTWRDNILGDRSLLQLHRLHARSGFSPGSTPTGERLWKSNAPSSYVT
jgi:hypothetical protein